MRHQKIAQMPVVGRGRGAMNRIRSKARQYGFQDQDVRPFRIRMYDQLEDNSSSLVFQTNLVNKEHPMEILLDKSDAFFAIRLGLGIHKVLLDANGKEIPANTPIIHYPDPNWFSGPAIAPGVSTEAQSLEMLYNALLSFKTDQNVRLENYDTQQLRFVTETQYDPNPPVKLWEQTGRELKYLDSNFGLWGNRRNELKIELRNGDYSAIAGVADDHINYAVLELDGFIIVRGAEAITKADMGLRKLFA